MASGCRLRRSQEDDATGLLHEWQRHVSQIDWHSQTHRNVPSSRRWKVLTGSGAGFAQIEQRVRVAVQWAISSNPAQTAPR